MKRYRELKGSELLSLKGKWIMHNSDIDNQSLVTNINVEQNSISTVDDAIPSKILVEEWRYEDGTPIGIEIELSHDDYTLEEFMTKVKDDCSNVEHLDGTSTWVEINLMKHHNLKSFIKTNGLDRYRIKPTQYIRPKVGFRGSVMCEVRDNKESDWIKVKQEVIAAFERNSITYFQTTDVVTWKCARLLPFSADNPPPEGARFIYHGCGSVFHFERMDDYRDAMHCSGGVIVSMVPEDKNVPWIDYEEVPNE